MTKTYSELIQYDNFEDRFKYLKLTGKVGFETFGFNRYLNQTFYKTKLWRNEIRPMIISRDMGCDLGLRDLEIVGPVIIHHINPITVEDVLNFTDLLINPEYMICVSDRTHKAIHYSDTNVANILHYSERSPNDTCPWRNNNGI